MAISTIVMRLTNLLRVARSLSTAHNSRYAHSLLSQPSTGFADGVPASMAPVGREEFERVGADMTPFMELMAVPKRKVTPSRKKIRNGPKALKPTPVIVKCKSCGRVKLPQFYCCSGEVKG
ncbi:hypothetical protein O6H91_01G020300 [Diphasiastrum complanatum]|uniref:Uncharacterized protein n=1 Tax=Diphasiastrum complanatum TaxID=34168 RepID=A0ACC2ENP0_DIPCM|nr:hypothetical protein O6H91_01G020300 [Diphasiastrum complanatum]